MMRLVVTILLLMTAVGCQEGMEAHDLALASRGKVEKVMVPLREPEAAPTLVKAEPLELTVVLNQYYLDGVTETTEVNETIWSMMDFWAEYEGWTLESQAVDRVVFSRKVEDISPLTKKQGYFGLTEAGELAVFQGLPSQGKVMESFKPVPVQPLESKRKLELEKGIKIKSYTHFKQVLERYSDQDVV
ncbi:BofC C-terminal domain-containing protein [Halobacillus salinus]|uniref:Bypass-of-forespore protein C n=1 Tax=Halobacillus salinus TaxID=192814 RepID=A0A4Z0H2L3_9BACI|nr:BofC C-terminal domain-containing protein [Halobacillus salinus]TGB04189.1 bypass-of-forespore protein C [Halobacillus salinus]